ncbi:CDK5RAP1-like protein [Sitodiplosis mosellana]|uniref:CDK5RAP1-like protein n=1 Tax=Sitodiplosis mosellana TaxID=263140 RepID=UPI002444111C|nr:CDK5RAP1-like protein [Sitodiplosis mosellana]
MRFLHLRNHLNFSRLSLIRCFVEQEFGGQATIRNSYVHQRCFSSKVAVKSSGRLPAKGPGLKEFLIAGKNSLVAQPNPITPENTIPYLNEIDYDGHGRKVFFEVYGCQMNVNDTEIVWSILKDNGYEKVQSAEDADVVLLMTCAIREKAESKIWSRLKQLVVEKKKRKTIGKIYQVGILGCMAERLKTELLEKEKSVDVISGPDSYKDLPRLLTVTKSGQSAVNVLLSLDETYADIVPVRLNENAVTAFVSIMRGCDNMCTYCIVPFTRGRERSRPIDTIENEAKMLADQGIKEITLLGQNVNSYRDLSQDSDRESPTNIVSGFKTVYKTKKGGMRFAELLERVAAAVPEVRIRFTSPHPKDFPDEVLHVMRQYPNICKNIHMPIQSGNNAVLERMRRGYTKEVYLDLIKHIRNIIPGVSFSSDFITGFCGETEAEFADTLSVMNQVKYHMAFMFAYSMREKTTAHRRFVDDVPQDVKNRRVFEMAQVYRAGAEELNAACVGKKQLILIEGQSKRSSEAYFGRNEANTKVIIPANVEIYRDYECAQQQDNTKLSNIQPGDFVVVDITESNSQVLKGTPLYHSTISDFSRRQCHN